MNTDTTTTGLQHQVRRRLLGHLNKLGDADPERRARAALAVAKVMREQELEWRTLLPPGSNATGEAKAPLDWKMRLLLLAHYPGVTAAETAEMMRMVTWWAPGPAGLAQLRQVAARVGVEF